MEDYRYVSAYEPKNKICEIKVIIEKNFVCLKDTKKLKWQMSNPNISQKFFKAKITILGIYRFKLVFHFIGK